MLSRRNFINTTLAAGAALATQGNAKGNAMAQSKRMIVDAQAHLWKAESEDWKWVPGRKPQLPEPFTIEKLVPMMDEGGVDRVVIVPPSWPGDRNDYALEAAKRYPTASPSWAASRSTSRSLPRSCRSGRTSPV